MQLRFWPYGSSPHLVGHHAWNEGLVTEARKLPSLKFSTNVKYAFKLLTSVRDWNCYSSDNISQTWPEQWKQEQMYINLLLRKPDSTIFKSFSMEDEKIRTLWNRISRIGQLLNTIHQKQINTWLVDAARESLTTSKQQYHSWEANSPLSWLISSYFNGTWCSLPYS